jgi:uncharacterized membrane protein YhiD involved in acid resistance
LFVLFSFDPFVQRVNRKESKEKTTNNRKGQKKRGKTIERVKRKDDKQSKGSKEKTTNNRKGQKKRRQTIERVKRKDDKQSKGSKEKTTNN